MSYKKEDVRNAIYELVQEERLKPMNIVSDWRKFYGVRN